MYDTIEPQEDLLGFQQSWTSYFFGPGTSSVVCFPFEGLSHPPQEPLIASFSSAQDWALAQDQQEAKEGEDEGLLRAWTYGFLGG